MIKSLHILNGHLTDGYNQAYYWVNDHPLYGTHQIGVKSMARAEDSRFSLKTGTTNTSFHSTITYLNFAIGFWVHKFTLQSTTLNVIHLGKPYVQLNSTFGMQLFTPWLSFSICDHYVT